MSSLRLRDVTLASLSEAVITTDVTGNVTFLNSEAERLTGWKNDEAVGRPLNEVFSAVHEESRVPVKARSRES